MKIKACDLTDNQRDVFVEAFYLEWNFDEVGEEDTESPAPWGCPWYDRGETILTGSTIEECAVNYFNDCKDELIELKKQYEAENE